MLASIEECFESSRDVKRRLRGHQRRRFPESRYPASSPVNTLLLDIMLPGMNGIAGIPRLLQRWPELDIVMLTNSDESDNIFRALQSRGGGLHFSKRRVNPNHHTRRDPYRQPRR